MIELLLVLAAVALLPAIFGAVIIGQMAARWLRVRLARVFRRETKDQLRHVESWVECDGRESRRALYPDLFAVLGMTFGGSDTTFKLPDLRHVNGALFMLNIKTGQIVSFYDAPVPGQESAT